MFKLELQTVYLRPAVCVCVSVSVHCSKVHYNSQFVAEQLVKSQQCQLCPPCDNNTETWRRFPPSR